MTAALIRADGGDGGRADLGRTGWWVRRSSARKHVRCSRILDRVPRPGIGWVRRLARGGSSRPGCCHALSLGLAAGLSSHRTLHAMACAWCARRVMMAASSDRTGFFGVPSGASSGRSFNRSMEERQQMSRVVWRSAAHAASRSAASQAGELSPRVVNAAPLSAVSSPTSSRADTCPDHWPRPRSTSRASIDGRRCARSRLDARRGACPSPTAPSPVVLAEAPTRVPCPLAPPLGPWRIRAAASVKRRTRPAATAPPPTPFAGRHVRLTLTRVSAHRHASDRGVVPSLLEETVQ